VIEASVTTTLDVLARVVRAREAIADGDRDLVRAILEELEHDLASGPERYAAGQPRPRTVA
jgi:hypothetical protein